MKNCKRILGSFFSIIMSICFVISSLSNIDIVSAEENQWKTEDFKLPVALRGACVEYMDGKMYVIGGESKKFSPVNTVYIYDFTTNNWSTGTPLSQPRIFSISAVIENKIYVMGGSRATTNMYYTISDVDIYDISNNTWSKGTSMPTTNGSVRSVIYQDKIYIFGGVDNNTGKVNTYINTIQIYDPIQDIWSTVDMPIKRHGYTLELIENKAYLIGGFDGTNHCNDVKIYDFTSNSWSEGKNRTNAKCYESSFTFNNKIYIYGGHTPDYNISNLTEIYDPVTDTWSKGNNLVLSRRLFDSIVHDNRVYIIGGEINLSTTTSTKTIESLQLPPADNRLFAHLYTNEKTQLSFSYDIADNQNLTWKSSDTRVATVDSNGMVTALETGTTYISAYNQNGIYLDYIPVKVTENDVYRMAIHLNSGQKQKLYFKGNPKSISWSSMDNSVATVSTNGEVTGISKGLAIVEAEWNGEKHYIYVRVN